MSTPAKECLRVKAGNPMPCSESWPNTPQAWCGVCRLGRPKPKGS